VLASDPANPCVSRPGRVYGATDALVVEKAFHAFARETLQASDCFPEVDWKLARTYGLRPELLVMTQLWRRPNAQEFVVAAKGAPEAVARLYGLDEAETNAVQRVIDKIRLLGVATPTHRGEMPKSQHEFDFTFTVAAGTLIFFVLEALRPIWHARLRL
jgi:Ca2+-transporting ATPase